MSRASAIRDRYGIDETEEQDQELVAEEEDAGAVPLPDALADLPFADAPQPQVDDPLSGLAFAEEEGPEIAQEGPGAGLPFAREGSYRQPLERPSLPVEVKDAQRQVSDLKDTIRYQTGLDTVPGGNYEAKLAYLQGKGEVETPETRAIDMGWDDFISGMAKNAWGQKEEFGKGLAVGGVALAAGAGTAALAGAPLLVGLGVVGAAGVGIYEGYRYLTNEPEVSPEARERYRALGAAAPDEQNLPSLGQVGREVARGEMQRMFGMKPVPGEENMSLPEIWSAREASWDEFVQQTYERPLDRLTDALIIDAAPGAIGRAATRGASIAGRVSTLGMEAEALASRVPGKVESELLKFGMKAAEYDNFVLKGAARLGMKGINKADQAATAFAEKEGLAPAIVGIVTDKAHALSDKGRQILDTINTKLLSNKLANKTEDLSEASAQKAQSEIYAALKTLPEHEAQSIPGILQHLERLPDDPSPPLVGALESIRGTLLRYQDELIKYGKLDDSTPEVRNYLPIVAKKNPGKRIPPREFDDDMILAKNADTSQINADSKASGLVDLPTYFTKQELADELAAARLESANLYKDRYDVPDFIKEPSYFPSYSRRVTDAKGKLMPQGVSPFFKQYTGAGLVRSMDKKTLQASLFQHIYLMERQLKPWRIIDEIASAQGEALKIGPTGAPIGLKEGYVPVDLDSMREYFIKNIGLGKRLAKDLDDMGDIEAALSNAVRTSIDTPPSATYIGRPEGRVIHQIPKAAAESLAKRLEPTNPWVRSLIDRPTQWWKTAVLPFSVRWHVNNLIGGLVLANASGNVPLRKLVTGISGTERDLLTDELKHFQGGFERMVGEAIPFSTKSIPTTAEARLSQAVDGIRPLRSVLGASEEPSIGSVRGVARAAGRAAVRTKDALLNWNTQVDQFYRARTYLGLMENEARSRIMKESGKAFIDSKEVLARMQGLATNKADVKALTDKLDSVFVNFNNMTNVERKFFRRVMPFWSWYREIGRLSLTLPFRSPVKTKIIQILDSMVGTAEANEIREHTGVPPSAVKRYTRGALFLGLDADGKANVFGIQGINPFYGMPTVPGIDPGQLHPVLKYLAQEATGKEFLGSWGNTTEIKTEKSSRRRVIGSTGKVEAGAAPPGAVLRFLRLFPQFGQLEDLTEYARTGDVTSRFSDTSPLLGEDGTIPNKERTGPKQSGRGQSRLLSAVGIPVRTVDLLEMMEQGLKDDKAALSEMTSKLTASRPEEREKLLEQMLRHQGEQRRGLEATDPGVFEREREQGYRRDRAPLLNRNQRSTPPVAPN